MLEETVMVSCNFRRAAFSGHRIACFANPDDRDFVTRTEVPAGYCFDREGRPLDEPEPGQEVPGLISALANVEPEKGVRRVYMPDGNTYLIPAASVSKQRRSHSRHMASERTTLNHEILAFSYNVNEACHDEGRDVENLEPSEYNRHVADLLRYAADRIQAECEGFIQTMELSEDGDGSISLVAAVRP